MKKYILFSLAFAASAFLAHAAPFDSKGVPADAQAVIHIDFETWVKTDIGGMLVDFAEKEIANDKDKLEAFNTVKNETGFNARTDLAGLTVGLFKNEADTSNPKGVAIVRGKFAIDKIIAASKKVECPVTKMGGYTVIDFSKMAAESTKRLEEKSKAKAKGEDDTEAEDEDADATPKKPKTMYLCLVDSTTAIFAETPDMFPKVTDALTGKAKSYVMPESFSTYIKQTTKPMIVAHVSRGLTPGKEAKADEDEDSSPMSIKKADSFQIILGENASDMRAFVRADYPSAEAAQQTNNMIQMMTNFMMMGANNDLSKASDGKAVSPEKIESAKRLQKLVSGLKTEIVEKGLNVTVDYPLADLSKIVKTFIESQSKKDELPATASK